MTLHHWRTATTTGGNMPVQHLGLALQRIKSGRTMQAFAATHIGSIHATLSASTHSASAEVVSNISPYLLSVAAYPTLVRMRAKRQILVVTVIRHSAFGIRHSAFGIRSIEL